MSRLSNTLFATLGLSLLAACGGGSSDPVDGYVGSWRSACFAYVGNDGNTYYKRLTNHLAKASPDLSGGQLHRLDRVRGPGLQQRSGRDRQPDQRIGPAGPQGQLSGHRSGHHRCHVPLRKPGGLHDRQRHATVHRRRSAEHHPHHLGRGIPVHPGRRQTGPCSGAGQEHRSGLRPGHSRAIPGKATRSGHLAINSGLVWPPLRPSCPARTADGMAASPWGAFWASWLSRSAMRLPARMLWSML